MCVWPHMLRKNTTYAQCQPTSSCMPGIHKDDPIQTPWSCHQLYPLNCSSSWGNCQESRCCHSENDMCYEKDGTYAQCRPVGNCTPGVHNEDPVPTPWSCLVLTTTWLSTSTAAPSAMTIAATSNATTTGSSLSGASNVPFGGMQTIALGSIVGMIAPETCAITWAACLVSKCCEQAGYTCYEKDTTYAQCQPTGWCKPGIHSEDPQSSSWSCRDLSAVPAKTTGAPPPMEPCENLRTDCGSWAEAGECKRNPGYMLVVCPRSCGVCSR